VVSRWKSLPAIPWDAIARLGRSSSSSRELALVTVAAADIDGRVIIVDEEAMHENSVRAPGSPGRLTVVLCLSPEAKAPEQPVLDFAKSTLHPISQKAEHPTSHFSEAIPFLFKLLDLRRHF